MKHVKTYENSQNWSEQKLKQHVADERYLHKYMSYYIYWKTEADPAENEFDVFWYDFDTPDKLLYYKDADGREREFVVEDLDELIEFLNNPQLLFDTKKYNL